MLHNYLDGVLRCVRHPITNGLAEGLNGKVVSFMREACGFRTAGHLTMAISLHCRGLRVVHARPTLNLEAPEMRARARGLSAVECGWANFEEVLARDGASEGPSGSGCRRSILRL